MAKSHAAQGDKKKRRRNDKVRSVIPPPALTEQCTNVHNRVLPPETRRQELQRRRAADSRRQVADKRAVHARGLIQPEPEKRGPVQRPPAHFGGRRRRFLLLAGISHLFGN